MNRRSILGTESLFAAALVCASLTVTLHARAQSNDALAELLFNEGRQLFNDGKFEQACPKLAQSLQADPAGGTVLLLAMCYEKQGRFASSWVKYSEALSHARRDGRADREKRARAGIAAVEPHLSYVKFELAPEATSLPNMTVAIDGSVMPVVTGIGIPTDLGAHQIELKAPGYDSYQSELTIAAEKTTEVFSIPLLKKTSVAEAPPPAPAAPPPSATQDTSSKPEHRAWLNTPRTIAVIVGTAGLVSAGVGGYFGYKAYKQDRDSDGLCPSSDCIDSHGVSLADSARVNARRADVFVGAGAAALTGAVVLWFLGAEQAPAQPTAVILPGGGALSLTGRF